MASCVDDTKERDARRPAGACRVLRIDLRRARMAELADQMRQGRYRIDARRLASDMLRLEPALFGEEERIKP